MYLGPVYGRISLLLLMATNYIMKTQLTVAQQTEACTITGAQGEITINGAYVKSYATKEKVVAKLKELGILELGTRSFLPMTVAGRLSSLEAMSFATLVSTQASRSLPAAKNK